MELLAIVVASLLLVPAVAFASGPVRIALGLAFVLFFPGYTLVAALFPKKGPFHFVERTALSFGLSIAVVPLVGLLLNYSPWGVRLLPVVLSDLVFIVAMAGVALYRRWRLPLSERFVLPNGVNSWRLLLAWRGQQLRDRAFTVLLVVAVAGVAAALVYAIRAPRIGERFTEFYVLGQTGMGENYPKEIVLGESGKVLLGLVNQEHETTSYKIEIRIGEDMTDALGPITLPHREKWEQTVDITPTRAGPRQKVEFQLYQGERDTPDSVLRLLISVKERE